MISSMTGFGRSQSQQDQKRLSIEVKSVNSRYCDIYIRAPRIFDEFEPLLREEISKKLKRGKIELTLSYQDESGEPQNVQLNRGLALGLKTAIEELGELVENPLYVKTQDLLKFSDLFNIEEKKIQSGKMQAFLLSTLQEALEKLAYHRRKEGAHLSAALMESLTVLHSYVQEIEQFVPQVKEAYFRRLEQKLKESIENYHLQKLTEERLMTELVIYSDKTDITEELVRLKNHIKLFEESLWQDDKEESEEVYQAGKRLDFLVQEMNREVNTIGSKANQSQITHGVVQLKCEIEKMREQIQNIL